jgi:hypothetical protein
MFLSSQRSPIALKERHAVIVPKPEVEQMNKIAITRLLRRASLGGLAISAGLMLFSTSAMAHDRVHLSVGIGVGGPAVVYRQPEVVYAQPEVVYAQPEVVYAQPEVVYAQPRVIYRQAPVVEYRGYYGWRHAHAWREHEWREHHDHDGWRHD